MKTLIILIIVLLAVLSTPLSLKKLIDRSKVTEKAKGGLSEWIDDPLLNGSALGEKEAGDAADAEAAAETAAADAEATAETAAAEMDALVAGAVQGGAVDAAQGGAGDAPDDTEDRDDE